MTSFSRAVRQARSLSAAVLVGHILLGALTAEGVGQRAGDEAAAQRGIDDVVAEALSLSNTPGAIIAVVVHDSIAFLRSYGRAGLTLEGDSPPDPGALFRVGAATELINGIAAAVLAQEGESQLDASLGGIVPDLPDLLQDITLAQLLSHTAGIAYVPAVPGRGGADDLGAASRQLTGLDRLADPGAIYSPSLSGASLAGYALERVAGVPYADIIRTTVFRPLGMETATLDFDTARPLLAAGHTPSMSPERPSTAVAPERDSTLAIPRRGLFASIQDLARLAAALMNDGMVDGEQTLPPGTVATVLAARAAIPGSTDEQIAFGVRLTRWEGQREIRLTGGGDGHGFLMRLLPDPRVGIIVLTNLSGTTLGTVAEFVFRRLLQLPTPAAPADVESPPARAYDDLRSLAGTYRNGSEVIDLLITGEQLQLRSGDLVLDVTEEDGVFTARITDGRPALRFRIVHDAAGRAFLWVNGRALAHQAPDRETM